MTDFDVMILGAGGVGCVVGGHLAAAGWRVQLINRKPDTAIAVAKDGLRLELDSGMHISQLDAATSDKAGTARFVMCFTKTHQTADAIQSVLPKLDPDCFVISMQNGLGNGAALSQLTGRDILHGVTLIPATVLGPGHIRSMGAHQSWLGPLDPDNERQKSAARALAEMLNQSGLDTEYHENVLIPIWQKACFNVAMNGVSALADASPGLIGDTKVLTDEVHALADEALCIAQAFKIQVDRAKIHSMIDFACKEHRYHLPSMLQDIRSERQTEIDSLNGYIVAQADQLGIDVPRCQLIAALIKARQSAPAFWRTQPSNQR